MAGKGDVPVAEEWEESFDGLEMPYKIALYDAEKHVLETIANGNITERQKLRASEGISAWFDDLRDKIGEAWVRFKTSNNVQNFMQELSEIWDKAMGSLGRLWDELRIKRHNLVVDVKTYLLKRGVDMQVEAMQAGFKE